MRFIKRLKILFNCNVFLIFLFVFALLYVFLRSFVWTRELPVLNETVFEGVVIDYEKSTDKLTLSLKGDVNIIAQYSKDFSVAYGDKVRIEGEYKEILNQTVPYAFSYKKYLENKDIAGVFKVEKIEKLEKGNFFYSIKNGIRNRIDLIDEKGYLLAFILGDKRSIDEDMYDCFSKIGVTHLFALSGMHVGILSGFFLLCFKKLPKGKYWLTSFFLLFYGILVGFPSSLKRCVFFFILNSLNKTFSLSLSSIKILLYVLIVLLFSNYKNVFDVGFLFSFVTVLGILLFSEKGEKNRLKSALKVSFVAFLFSLPITLSTFYSVNFLSILYNLFYIPFVSLLLYPFALFTFLFPFLSPLFNFLVNILEHITLFLSKLDFLTLYLSFSGIFIIIYYLFLFLFYKTKKKLCFFLLIILIFLKMFLPYFDSKGYIYFFDVGQGDSCLVISPYRKDVILIDTGGVPTFKGAPYYVSDAIISFFKHEGIKKIDYLILSHGDADHVLDTLHLSESIAIDKVKVNFGEINTLEKNILDKLEEGEYYAKNLSLQFLNQEVYSNENDNSLFTLIKIYHTTFLTSGDASKKQEEEIIKKYALDTSIVKLGHHGSKTSSSYTYLEHIQPQYAIISSGRNNRYHHPNQETIATLESLSIPYMNTQTDGTILFKIDMKGITKFTFPP